jgi:hypothetical protein
LIVGQRLFWEVKVASQIERNGKPQWDPNLGSSSSTIGGGSDEREIRGSGGEAMALRYGLFAEAYLQGPACHSSRAVHAHACAWCRVA